MYFTPNEDFWSGEFQSQYQKGLKYRVRPGNTRLADFVRTWEAEGKVRVLHVAEIAAHISGSDQPAPLAAPSFWKRIMSWI